MVRFRVLSLLLALWALPSFAQITPTRLVRTPDIHGDMVVFSAEGDLWLGSLSAGTAQRLTTHDGLEINPRFSPDGKWIGFSAAYDGGQDVYVMPVEGGAPRRVTYDPSGAQMVGWSPDGSKILFRSSRESTLIGQRLFTVSAQGGVPTVLPMDKAAQGWFSPDGSKLAFVRTNLENHHWKRYHGGEANSIWIGDLRASKFNRIENNTINEQYPVWAGDSIYYISEKNGTANLWRYDVNSKSNQQLTHRDDYDIKSPSTDGKRLIYVWGNQLWVRDLASGAEEQVKLRLTSDLIHARPLTLPGALNSYDTGPTGKRVVVEGRGQIYTLPVTSGEVVGIANKIGTRSKDPQWSPDGKSIAFVSDRSGEENIWIAPASGDGEPRMLTHEAGQVLDNLMWSPDSKKICYTDTTNSLLMLDADSGAKTVVATTDYGIDSFRFSPDSKWITYAREEGLFVSSICLYRIADKKATRLTFPPTKDGAPVFDPTGKYLYFLSQRGLSPKFDDFDFQIDFTGTTKIYLITLAADTPSPMPVESDEEPGASKAAAKEVEEAKGDIKIDLDGISERIMEVPVSGGDYLNLDAIPGKILYIERGDDGETALQSFSFKDKKETALASGVSSFTLADDHSKLLARVGNGLQMVDAGSPFTPSDGKVDLASWRVQVDPAAEWNQIFEQAWRQHRDIFYDPAMHGMDWNAVHKRYAALIPSVGARSELNDIIGDMQGELNVSHEFVGGGFNRGQLPSAGGVGSLGAKLEYDSGAKAYKIVKIYRGDGFEFDARSPLLTPGLNVKEGDYVYSINGVPLKENEDPHKLLLEQGGKVVRLQVGSSLASAKTVRVKAALSESKMHYLDWTTSNRAYVTKYGGANIGYVHVPDMGPDGMAEFSKQFYACLDKDGIIIDVRYNTGGSTSGMVLERLRRIIFEYDQGRYGAPQPYHRTGYPGRVVALCNEQSSSDAEYFCTGFKYEKLGPVIGTRTWGGFVAVGGFPTIDGGFVSTPVMGSFTPEGQWLPDGTGFTPDYIVEEDPNQCAIGRDTQMDKAIEVLKELIRKDPPKWPKRQDPPSKVKAFKKGG